MPTTTGSTVSGSEWVRNRGWQWKQGLSDGFTAALVVTVAVVVALSHTGLGTSWQVALIVVAGLAAWVAVLVLHLASGIAQVGDAVLVRNRIRRQSIPVTAITAATTRKTYGRNRYLALAVHKQPDGLRRVTVVALNVEDRLDPAVRAAIPVFTGLEDAAWKGWW